MIVFFWFLIHLIHLIDLSVCRASQPSSQPASQPDSRATEISKSMKHISKSHFKGSAYGPARRGHKQSHWTLNTYEHYKNMNLKMYDIYLKIK